MRRDPMRLTWLPLALLLAAPALPARAATQQIRLMFISPVEIEGMLRTSHAARPLDQASKVGSAEALRISEGETWALVPEGGTAVSADSRTNSLWVSGSEEAIRTLK